ncbi:MAG: NAD-dependent epimerase/dehydratase family protein, partial [Planctomycetota bacterium]
MTAASPVMVTGATGFVAGWIIRRLLEEGRMVHAAVRDPANKAKLSHLEKLGESLPGSIRFFAADLLNEGSYAEAMEGCEVVFHTASPFTLNVEDPQRDLLDPALLGTRNVLGQACVTPSVRRVVVTSSYTAAIGDNADLVDLGKPMVTEEDWNTTSSLKHQPYAYSKTMAEKEAWRIAASQTQWTLVTINPAFVMGPYLKENPTTESFQFMKKCADGTFESGIPNIGMTIVDVRDVAEAHLAAARTPEAQGRYLVSAGESNLPEFVEILRKRFGNGFRFPRRTLPKWVVWVFGPIADKLLERKVVARNVGHRVRLDNSRSLKDLSISYRPISETLIEMFQQMIDDGVIVSR